MTPRERHHLGPAGQPCSICGRPDVVLVESRNVRRLRDRFNSSWDPRVRVTAACNHCGARSVLDEHPVASAS